MICLKADWGDPSMTVKILFLSFSFLEKKRLTRESECGKINESPNGE